MLTQVLWALDNDIDDRRFERLCTDLMGREGFRNIIPVGGTHDRGRDAEIYTHKGIDSQGEITFFQYSLEKSWENKLDRELKKVKANGHTIHHYVFVTTQTVTGHKRDALAKEARVQYGWKLTIFDREWFRHRLEEQHPDLALKYLGVQSSIQRKLTDVTNKPPIPPEEINLTAWQLYMNGNYEAAIVAFKELLKSAPNNPPACRALAWCQYSLYRYEEAMLSINQALALNEADETSWSLKASILTEDAIRRNNTANLIKASNIFKRVAEGSRLWVDHYNYGNVLSALGQYEAAKLEFRTAIQYDSQQALVWNNLAITYYHLHDHDEELKCYDQALTINPNLSEALTSKGVTLLKVFGKYDEAAALIAKAIEVDDFVAIRWPYTWYWLASAYYECGRYEQALQVVNTALETVLRNKGLLDLKALLLSRLWKKDRRYTQEAIDFFRERLDVSAQDYESIAELASLYEATDQIDLSWGLMAGYSGLDKADLIKGIGFTAHSLTDVLQAFKYFPTYQAFRENTAPLREYTGTLKDSQIEFEDDFELILFIVLAIPFGLACSILQPLSQGDRMAHFGDIYSVVQTSLAVSMPRITTKMLRNIDRDNRTAVAERISHIFIAWHFIPLVELSHQIGFIAGLASIPIDLINQAIEDNAENLEGWRSQISEETLVRINEVLHIFKE
jgi:tetratricopeptide (TPR) repeat protein